MEGSTTVSNTLSVHKHRASWVSVVFVVDCGPVQSGGNKAPHREGASSVSGG